MSSEELSIQLLGAVRVTRGGQELSLAQSKKTKALLAYLAVTQRSHRRERLCNLLWDVADDPRGALRWSLSKLRRVVDEGEERRIVATRDAVEFAPGSAFLDVLALRKAVAKGLAAASNDELAILAPHCRGEFLEGLEMADFMGFQAWCIAEREELRRQQSALFKELVGRRQEDAEVAIPHARSWVQLDPLSVEARISLMKVLYESGRKEVAAHQREAGQKILLELGIDGKEALDEAWKLLVQGESSSRSVPEMAPQSKKVKPKEVRTVRVMDKKFVGRAAEFGEVFSALSDACERRSQRVAVLSGEPGLGKTTLAEKLITHSEQRGGLVLRGKAYDAEGHRPYGPWVDAVESIRSANKTGSEMRALLQERGEGEGESSRDRFFATVGDFVADCCTQNDHVLLVIDDVQWIDSDSIELLHYVVRMSRNRPFMVLLLARGGELADNAPALRVLRSLRRDFGASDIELGYLSQVEVKELLSEQVDADGSLRIYEASAGNPLYALELARAHERGDQKNLGSVVDAVRDRVDQISGNGPELLRWCAVLGHDVDVGILEQVASESLEELVEGLETLERHGLLASASAKADYVFAHDVVREAVYSQMSHPRRRLMHRRISEVYGKQKPTVEQAINIAHHAGLAGDAEASVDACVRAGRYLLRVYANGEAANLARRGLHHAEALGEEERTEATIMLLQVQYGAGVPFSQEAEERLRSLAEKATDYGLVQAARLAFHIVSYLRWNSGDLIRAHERMMDAERVSRMVKGDARATALAEAARCLVLVEKNLGQAEAFTMEAQSLGEQGESNVSITRAQGMLLAHQGEYEMARKKFEESRVLAQRSGDRISEFMALEEIALAEIDEENYPEAERCAESLCASAAKLREGSESPRAMALLALVRWASNQEADGKKLELAKEALAHADSKYHLGFIYAREAQIWLCRGDIEKACDRAAKARDFASAVHRTSELVRAHIVLLEVARRGPKKNSAEPELEALKALKDAEMSKTARSLMTAALAPQTAT